MKISHKCDIKGQRCHLFEKTGSCRFGERCKYNHHLSDNKSPIGSLHAHQFPQRRRARHHQDVRRYKSFYPESGRMTHSKGWHSGGSEPSPRPCTDTSPRSTIDANGTFRQSVSPQSTQTHQNSPLPHPDMPMNGFPESGGHLSHGLENGHHLAKLLHQTMGQNGNALASRFFHPDYLTWPFIESSWYGSGVPNATMQMRLEKERDSANHTAPTAPSHFLKPFRSQDGAFLHVRPFFHPFWTYQDVLVLTLSFQTSGGYRKTN